MALSKPSFISEGYGNLCFSDHGVGVFGYGPLRMWSISISCLRLRTHVNMRRLDKKIHGMRK